MEIKRLLTFLELTLKFRDVYRSIKIPGKDPSENDVEHSYQLAMFAWYIATADKLPLDTNKIIKYALVHDFVEVYAGDIDTHSKDTEALKAKPAREEEARKQLMKEFPEFTEFHDAILEYEHKSNEEARFVYGIDKMIAEMNVYLEGNTTNAEKGLTIEQIRKNKDPKIAVSPQAEKYWHAFLPLWEELQKKTLSPGS